MTILGRWAVWALATGCATAIGVGVHAAARSRVALSQTLPSMEGGRVKASVVEVTYEPGESSAPHSHPCPVIVYIVEGAIRTKVSDEREQTYGVGESFYEAANGAHLVSANASDKAPAKFVAFFVCDHDTPLSVEMPKGRGVN